MTALIPRRGLSETEYAEFDDLVEAHGRGIRQLQSVMSRVELGAAFGRVPSDADRVLIERVVASIEAIEHGQARYVTAFDFSIQARRRRWLDGELDRLRTVAQHEDGDGVGDRVTLRVQPEEPLDDPATLRVAYERHERSVTSLRVRIRAGLAKGLAQILVDDILHRLELELMRRARYQHSLVDRAGAGVEHSLRWPSLLSFPDVHERFAESGAPASQPIDWANATALHRARIVYALILTRLDNSTQNLGRIRPRDIVDAVNGDRGSWARLQADDPQRGADAAQDDVERPGDRTLDVSDLITPVEDGGFDPLTLCLDRGLGGCDGTLTDGGPGQPLCQHHYEMRRAADDRALAREEEDRRRDAEREQQRILDRLNQSQPLRSPTLQEHETLKIDHETWTRRDDEARAQELVELLSRAIAGPYGGHAEARPGLGGGTAMGDPSSHWALLHISRGFVPPGEDRSGILPDSANPNGSDYQEQRKRLLRSLAEATVEYEAWRLRAGGSAEAQFTDDGLTTPEERRARVEALYAENWRINNDSPGQIEQTIRLLESETRAWRVRAAAVEVQDTSGGQPAYVSSAPTAMRGRTDIVAEDSHETVALADLSRGEVCALAVDDPMAFTRALEMAQERARSSACCRGRRKISVRHLIEVHGDWQRSYTYELARKHGIQVRRWSRL